MRKRHEGERENVSRTRRTVGLLMRSSLALPFIMVSGCAQLSHYHYGDLEWKTAPTVDLEIETYPAGHGSDGFCIPFVYLMMHTEDHVFFQVYLPDQQNCTIKGFSYQFEGEDRVVLITEDQPVKRDFWQQRQDPIPYVKGRKVSVWVKIELDGEDCEYEGTVRGMKDVGLPLPLFVARFWAT